ncbi:MAG: metal ABC transporter permease [Pseudomonadota bacterium]
MSATLFDPLILRVILGGLGIAIVSGALGTTVVWRRMAFMGDSLAHASLVGVALAFVLKWPTWLGIAAVAILLALIMTYYLKRKTQPADTLLLVVGQFFLALGFVMMYKIPSLRADLLAFLYGDILTLSWSDVAGIYLGSAILLLILQRIWTSLLLMTLDPALAAVEGVNVSRVQYLHAMLLAITIAWAIKFVGVLLVSALLVIPAASARAWATNPTQHALLSAVFGCISVVSGILLAYALDIPAGPAIVMTSVSLFVISHLKASD